MTYISSRALELLRAGTGMAKARFRDGQEEAIRQRKNSSGEVWPLALALTGNHND